MCSLFTRNVPLADIMDGLYDIHCHLLPGVDDGSPDSEHSHALLEKMYDMGMAGAYLTPHIIYGMYGSRNESDMRAAFAEFDYSGPLSLRLGAEYFLDEGFPGHISDRPLTMGGNHILAEFALNAYANRSLDMLFEASLSGYNIIIAHPERYAFLSGSGGKNLLKQLRDKGFGFQLNLLSLTGYHGKGARQLAVKFLTDGLYAFLGTDTHSSVYLHTIKNASIPGNLMPMLEKLRENNRTLIWEAGDKPV